MKYATRATFDGVGVGTLGSVSNFGVRTGHPDWVLMHEGDTFTDDGPLFPTFSFGEIACTGLSADEPLHFTSWNSNGASSGVPRGTLTGTRPIMAYTDPTLYYINAGMSAARGTDYYTDYLAITDLEFYNVNRDYTVMGKNTVLTDNDMPAIRITGKTHFILVEGCKCTYMSGLLGIGGDVSDSVLQHPRVIYDHNITAFNYTSEARFGLAVGQYIVNTGQFTNEENFFYHDGWTKHEYVSCDDIYFSGTLTNGDVMSITFTNSNFAGFPRTFNHTVNTGSDTFDTIAIGFIAAINADASCQAIKLAASHKIGNTVSVGCPDTNSNQTVVSWNVSGAATETIIDMSSDPSGAAGGQRGIATLYSRTLFNHSIYQHPCSDSGFTADVTAGNVSLDCAGADRPGTTDCIDNHSTRAGSGMNYSPSNEYKVGRIGDNVVQNVFGWSRGDNQGTAAGDAQWGIFVYGKASGNDIDNNIVTNCKGSNSVGLGIYGGFGAANMSVTNNITADTTTASPFQDASISPRTYSNNVAIQDWTTAKAAHPEWVSPDRTIDTYAVSLGYADAAAMADYVVANQNRTTWDIRFSSNAINNYIRAGFGKAAVAGVGSSSSSVTTYIRLGALGFRLHS